jgi:hypothetical protein
MLSLYMLCVEQHFTELNFAESVLVIHNLRDYVKI